LLFLACDMEKKNGNWTIKNTKKIFENDFFTVYEDEVIQPDGKPGAYATAKFVPGICVLPIDDDGFVYLTKQFRYSAGQDALETVAGALENEKPLEAAKRELKEELGITAGELTELGTVQLDNSIIKNEATFFIARKLKFEKPDRDSSEEIKVVKIKFREAIDKIFAGEISHSLSRALLLQAWVQSGKSY